MYSFFKFDFYLCCLINFILNFLRCVLYGSFSTRNVDKINWCFVPESRSFLNICLLILGQFMGLLFSQIYKFLFLLILYRRYQFHWKNFSRWKRIKSCTKNKLGSIILLILHCNWRTKCWTFIGIFFHQQ